MDLEEAGNGGAGSGDSLERIREARLLRVRGHLAEALGVTGTLGKGGGDEQAENGGEQTTDGDGIARHRPSGAK